MYASTMSSTIKQRVHNICMGRVSNWSTFNKGTAVSNSSGFSYIEESLSPPIITYQQFSAIPALLQV